MYTGTGLPVSPDAPVVRVKVGEKLPVFVKPAPAGMPRAHADIQPFCVSYVPYFPDCQFTTPRKVFHDLQAGNFPPIKFTARLPFELAALGWRLAWVAPPVRGHVAPIFAMV